MLPYMYYMSSLYHSMQSMPRKKTPYLSLNTIQTIYLLDFSVLYLLSHSFILHYFTL